MDSLRGSVSAAEVNVSWQRDKREHIGLVGLGLLLSCQVMGAVRVLFLDELLGWARDMFIIIIYFIMGNWKLNFLRYLFDSYLLA